MMRLRSEFDWSSEESATKHGISKEEIESVFDGRVLEFKVGKRVFMALGKDAGGSLMEVVYRVVEGGKIRVFHCMPARDALRKRYRGSIR